VVFGLECRVFAAGSRRKRIRQYLCENQYSNSSCVHYCIPVFFNNTEAIGDLERGTKIVKMVTSHLSVRLFVHVFLCPSVTRRYRGLTRHHNSYAGCYKPMISSFLTVKYVNEVTIALPELGRKIHLE